MKFVFYSNSASPHQLPLSREVAKRLGDDDYRYVYAQPLTEERRRLGWGTNDDAWLVYEGDCPDECRLWLETCDVLMCGLRDFDLFAKRLSVGRKTIYTSERWFKPINISFGLLRLSLPGWLRLMHPRHFSYARRMARLIGGNGDFSYYPLGVWARQDMVLIARLFGVPREKYCSRIRLWGYCVEPSKGVRDVGRSQGALRVLWVGRMLDWKRVDDIIRAVASRTEMTLDVYGTGPMENRWKKLAERIGNGQVLFHGSVSIVEVRSLMRSHDVYVLASDGGEGWGAALNEAIEEGMRVVGTYEAGASATILPQSNLYHAGDWRTLASLLAHEIPSVSVGPWNPSYAAAELVRELT